MTTTKNRLNFDLADWMPDDAPKRVLTIGDQSWDLLPFMGARALLGGFGVMATFRGLMDDSVFDRFHTWVNTANPPHEALKSIAQELYDEYTGNG